MNNENLFNKIISAHKFCCNNKPFLEKDTLCGCFYCLNIFHPDKIEEYITADNPADYLGTALCPYCGIDSVIGKSSNFPITKEFLKAMQQYYF